MHLVLSSTEGNRREEIKIASHAAGFTTLVTKRIQPSPITNRKAEVPIDPELNLTLADLPTRQLQM
jgi:hypothetical protein